MATATRVTAVAEKPRASAVAAGDLLNGSAAGRVVVERSTPVSTRDLLCFAAGVGAVDDIYLDDARAGGIVAAPGFHCAFEWPCIMADGYLEALGIARERLLQIKLHAFQDTRFLAPIRPNSVYRTTLRIAEIRQVRPGCLVVSEMTTANEATGEIVTKSFYGSIFRGARADNEVISRELPQLRDEAGISEPFSHVAIPVSRALPQVYTACSDIWNPIHTERQFALDSGLPDIILHGTCTWTLAGLALLGRNGRRRRLTRLAGRFSSIVLPEQDLGLSSRVAGPGIEHFAVRRADGEVALSHGIMESAEA